MQIKYFQTAWNDLKNSPGWFGKMCLLALVNFIPIFGQIVSYGYLYGWARDIAWGAHQPLKSSIFANEDGKFWRRGWFLFVIEFVFALVPGIIMSIGSSMQGASIYSGVYSMYGSSGAATVGSAASAGVGSLIYLVGALLAVFISIFVWIASMRSAIYDRLSPGFQLGTIWKMFRHDTNGIMRIFGMCLLLGLIVGVVFTIVVTVAVLAGLAAGAGGALASGNSATAILVSLGAVAVTVLLALVFLLVVASTIIEALVVRAVGYWTMQFDVPHWRGQDDPLPFEQMPPADTNQYPTY